jgi:hypothetical protein
MAAAAVTAITTAAQVTGREDYVPSFEIVIAAFFEREFRIG